MANINSLGNLNNNNKKEDSANRKTYVGGEKSGLYVEDNKDDLVNKIVNKAKE